jgi:hypothetical protein
MGQLYKMVIKASGEVRDAEGNLISSEPVESELTLTESQLQGFLGGDAA